MFKFKNHSSKYAIALCLLMAVIYILTSKNWRHEGRIIGSDVISYYAYLPATFIFNDIKLEKQETLKKGTFWPVTLPDGTKVIKTSMGMSMLYAPFFFMAHYTAKLLGLEAYGYSPIYKGGLLLSAFVYLFLGLFFLRKILKEYFSEQIASLTIIVVTLGTNLIYYSTSEASMSHVYNFALINVFVYGTIKWFRKPALRSLILLGFLSGLIALVRPSNILVLLFFSLFGVYSFQTFRYRLKFIFSHFHWFVLMGIAFFIVWIPQIFYWHSLTGKLFFNPYTNEGFFFGNPQFLNGLFSYRKGFFIYTPVMLLAILGMPFLVKRLKDFSWAIPLFIILSMYVVFSWWCWWYGGSFGMRPMVDYYGIFAISLAVLFEKIWQFRKKMNIVVLGLVCFFVMQNYFFIEKYKRNSFHWDSTTKESFWHSFWHVRPQNGYWETLKQPDYEKALEGIYVYKDKKETN